MNGDPTCYPGTGVLRNNLGIRDAGRLEAAERVQRIFLEHLAIRAGHTLDRSLIDPNRWMEASIQSFGQPIDGNHEIMTDVIRQALVEDRRDDR